MRGSGATTLRRHSTTLAPWTSTGTSNGRQNSSVLAKELDAVTDADIAALIAWRRSLPAWGREGHQVSNATINRDTVETLKRVFMRAKKVWKLQLPVEPDWRSHHLKEPTERVRELHEHEEDAIEAAVRGDYAPWLEFVRATGLELGETLLSWKCVDWKAKLITTTGKGDREVRTPITPDIEAILKPLKGHHSEAVFTFVAKRTAQGQVRGQRYPITYQGAKTHWRRLRAKAGVKDFRLHDLRHDTACKLLRATGNMKLVQQALNHTSITTTARYAHVCQDDLAAALQQLSESRQKSRHKDDKAA